MILNMKFVWILKGDWLQTNEYSEQEKNSLTSSLKKVKISLIEKRSALRVVKKDYVVVLFWDKEVKMTLHHVLFCSVLRIAELQKVKRQEKVTCFAARNFWNLHHLFHLKIHDSSSDSNHFSGFV